MMTKPVRIQIGDFEYVSRVPKIIPSGKILVHNHVSPKRKIWGDGFRAWLVSPSNDYEVCDCGWKAARHIIKHYRCKGD